MTPMMLQRFYDLKQMAAEKVDGSFGKNSVVENKNAFASGMYGLTVSQAKIGFHNQSTQTIRAAVCRAAAFDNGEALDTYANNLPNMLTKKTWIPVPLCLSGLPLYPSKEHREQDMFRKYVNMATTMAKGDMPFTPLCAMLGYQTEMKLYKRVDDGLAKAHQKHTSITPRKTVIAQSY